MATYNLTVPYDPARSGVLAAVLALIIALTLVINIMFLYMFFRMKKTIRRPPNYFLASLAFVDILGALLWALPALISVAQWSWFSDSHMCNFHSYMAMWCYCMNMHLFVTMLFEKFCKILFPSKHKDAFYNKLIVVVIIIALCIFDMVISFLPLVGWGSITFTTWQYQCNPDFEQSVSHLNFTFCVTYAIPIVANIILIICIGVKVKRLKQKVGPSTNARFVLEEKKDVPKESFAEKLKKQQASFQMAGMKKKKPKIGGKKARKEKRKQMEQKDLDDGYETESSTGSISSHFESSDSETEYIRDYDDFKRMQRDKVLARKKKRVYTFRRTDFLLAITIIICFVIFALLWLGWWVMTYVYVYDPLSAGEPAYVFFTLLSFGGLCFKPLVYLSNKQLRVAFVESFKCKCKREEPPSGQMQAPPPPEVKTRTVERHFVIEESTSTTKYRSTDGTGGGTTTTTTSSRTGPEMVNLYQNEETKFSY